MNLYVADLGNFKLDGGAMFGVVPRVLWEKKIQPDGNNLCNWATRCLLIEEGDRLILIDTGLGDKQSEKFFSYYYRSNTVLPREAVKNLGFSPEEVTDVFLTHLHFDHVGGAVLRDGKGRLVPAFPNATYWSNEHHWDWAIRPNPREKASFLEENMLPIRDSGQLEMINITDRSDDLPFDIITVDGHTEKQMLPVISWKGEKIVFMADLLPSAAHIPLAWVMGYDVRPLQTMKEKEQFLNTAADEEYVLFFEHDAQHECGRVRKTEKGIRLDSTFPLREIE